MKIEELIQCLEAVSEYEKGEGENIIQYENEFLLSNEDVKELLKYIKNKDNVIKEIREYLKLREDDNSMCSVCGVMSDRILEILDKENI